MTGIASTNRRLNSLSLSGIAALGTRSRRRSLATNVTPTKKSLPKRSNLSVAGAIGSRSCRRYCLLPLFRRIESP
jgi:hypothetical protein